MTARPSTPEPVAERAPAGAVQKVHATGERIVVPVLAEQLKIEKKVVASEGVRVVKHVSTHDEHIDVPLVREEVEVERREIGTMLETAPEPRIEGDATVVPVFEEILVVEKKILLREELWIRRKAVHGRAVADIPVSHEEVTIERLPIEKDASTARSLEVAGREEVAEVQTKTRRVEEIVLAREHHQKRLDVSETLRAEEVEIHPVAPGARRSEQGKEAMENRNLERPKVAIVDADRTRNAIGRGVNQTTGIAKAGARKLGVGSIVLLVLLALVLVFVLSSIF